MGTRIKYAWRVLTAKSSLEGKMKIILHTQDYYHKLVDELEKQATLSGKLDTLEALRKIVNEKIGK